MKREGGRGREGGEGREGVGGREGREGDGEGEGEEGRRAAWREGSMSRSIVDAGDVKKKKKRN